MPHRSTFLALVAILALSCATPSAQTPQGSAFTYQGVLKHDGQAINGSTDMVFDLFDAPTGGNAVGPSLQFKAANANAVNVRNGVFEVTLDFGAAAFITHVSDQRFLSVTVDGTTLSPRTPIQNAPFALQSQTAELSYGVTNASIGAAQIIASQVQRRVGGSCSGGATISAIGQDGSVSCQVGAGSGTITGVSAGNGLAGGGTNGSVSLGISNPLNLSGTAAGGVAAVQNTAPNGIGVQGSATGAGSYGVRGQSDTGAGVRGEASSASGASANGVYGLSQSSAGSGVVGVDYANYGMYGAGATGVYGTGNYGVQGYSTALSGAGVWGFSSAGGARGVYGESSADNGAGVEGVSNGSQGVGVEGIDNNGYGVQGIGVTGLYGSGSVYGAIGRGTTGVRGESTDTAGYGVYGQASAASGTPFGVYGDATLAPLGVGVFGHGRYGVKGSGATGLLGIGVPNIYGFGIGVDGTTSDPAGYGVRGANTAINGVAVQGLTIKDGGIGVDAENLFSGTPANNSSPPIGLFALTNSLGGLAVYAKGDAVIAGNTDVVGTLSKTSGSFKIDHPLDPANKYLYHSFVESPDMKNVYDGIVTLDARGEAWVELPSYFEALNRDFRYQLTALDQAAPSLHVAHRVEGNRFQLAGGAPNQEVSWQVTGTRKDAYAEAHRIVPEVDKAPSERGKYLHPTLFGHSASAGIEFSRTQAVRRRRSPDAAGTPSATATP